ncbi:hypothetical protein RRG08_026575 [Elysia crispata]|uniref:Uncharacterized protein n=1 Tax=Elysia crispata TaxID=231223 RepID=A0AAE1CSD3_9GAST|nr:hypothetical protein RRG08_026575 [Elysia crispata]
MEMKEQNSRILFISGSRGLAAVLRRAEVKPFVSPIVDRISPLLQSKHCTGNRLPACLRVTVQSALIAGSGSSLEPGRLHSEPV